MPVLTLVAVLMTIFAPLWLLSFFFFSLEGFFWASALGLVTLVIFAVFGSQILLHFLNGKKSRQGLARDVLDNLSFHLEVPGPDLYRTDLLPNGFYFLNSLVGRPTMVVGGNVEATLNEEELRSLLMAGLLRFRTTQAFWRTLLSLSVFFVSLPLLFLPKTRLSLSSQAQQKGTLYGFAVALGVIVKFLYSPLLKVCELGLGSCKRHQKYDKEVMRQLGTRASLKSALTKLGEERVNKDFFVSIMDSNISVLTHFNSMDFDYLLMSENPLKQRLSFIGREG